MAFALCWDEDITEAEFVACVYTLIPPGDECYDSLDSCACWFVYYTTGEWVCNSQKSFKENLSELSSSIKIYKNEKKANQKKPTKVLKQDSYLTTADSQESINYISRPGKLCIKH